MRARDVRRQHREFGVRDMPDRQVLTVDRGVWVRGLHVRAAGCRVWAVRAAVHGHCELPECQVPRLRSGADFNLYADPLRVAARLHELRGRDIPGDELRRRDRVSPIMQQLQSGFLHEFNGPGPVHDLQQRRARERVVRCLGGTGDERCVPDLLQRRVGAAFAERGHRVQPVWEGLAQVDGFHGVSTMHGRGREHGERRFGVQADADLVQ